MVAQVDGAGCALDFNLSMHKGVGALVSASSVCCLKLVAWLCVRYVVVDRLAWRVLRCGWSLGLACASLRLVAWCSVRAGKLDSSRASRCKNTPQTRANWGFWCATFNNARLAAYFSSRRTRLVTLFFAWVEQPALRLDAHSPPTPRSSSLHSTPPV